MTTHCVWTAGVAQVPLSARLASDADEFDVMLLWHSYRKVKVLAVHRFFHPIEDSAPTVERCWRDAVASFAGHDDHLYVSIYGFEPVKARKLFCTPAINDVLILNAGTLLDKRCWRNFRRDCMPIPLIKNFIQFEALKFYGGIWADLDVFWTGKTPPYSFQEKAHPAIDLPHEAELFTEYLGTTGQCMRPSEETKPPATINLGFAYSFPKAAFWEKCLEECLMHWGEGGGQGFQLGSDTAIRSA